MCAQKHVWCKMLASLPLLVAVDIVFNSYATVCSGPGAMERFVRFVRMDEDRAIRYNKACVTSESLPTAYTPLLVEDTWCGFQSEFIVKAIEGWDKSSGPLRPHGAVCCRLLRRLADVLMGLPDANRTQRDEYFDARRKRQREEARAGGGHSSGKGTGVGIRTHHHHSHASTGGEEEKVDHIGTWNDAEKITTFDGAIGAHIGTQCDPKAQMTYEEEADDEQGSVGVLKAPGFVQRMARELLLPAWWWPNLACELELGKWVFSEEDNLHRDIQHRGLVQYDGLQVRCEHCCFLQSYTHM